jgi:uncharacterized zinc-type alcohol dehydrogenase-like protein
MVKIIGYAANNSHADLKPMNIERSEPANNEVEITILYCGVCHSDIHQARNEWKNTVYPCMPGHEIVGRVNRVGANVTKYKVNDLVGVGCMVDSCHQCESCQEGLEQYCKNGFLATYNGNMRTPKKENLTYGGFSSLIVVREDFVLKIPENLEPAAAAPLMCAGVTTFSPMRHWKVGKGTRVGIIGLGGLGHMAIKLAIALGAQVTLITTSENKVEDAHGLGAKNVIISANDEEMKKNKDTLDFILSTIPQSHDVNPYMSLLRRDGVLTIVGCIAPLKNALDLGKMIPDRKTLSSSLIGGIAETQEVLDFCGKHNIVSNIQIIPIDKINEAFKEIDAGHVDFRYVIDMSTLANKTPEKTLMEKILDK